MGSLKFAALPAAATNRTTPSPRHPSPSDTSTHSPPSPTAPDRYDRGVVIIRAQTERSEGTHN
eukprot:5646869-Prymnesium_polylepis.1